MNIVSHSQAGQDLFALYMTQYRSLPKTYLDIGCQGPFHNNNTFLLEQYGWKGLSIDIEDFHYEYANYRSNPFYQADVTTINWEATLSRLSFYDTNTIDYLSFDVDDATYLAFLHFPFDKIRFRVITIEHDSYRVGNNLRDMLRYQLENYGYTLVCADVSLSGFGEFEDWWVDMKQVDMSLVSKVQCSGKDSVDICTTMCY